MTATTGIPETTLEKNMKQRDTMIQQIAESSDSDDAQECSDRFSVAFQDLHKTNVGTGPCQGLGMHRELRH